MKRYFFSKQVLFFTIVLTSFINFSNLLSAEDLPILFFPIDVSSGLANKTTFPLEDRISVSVDFSIIKSQKETTPSIFRMKAALPDRVVILSKERVEERGENDYTWFGRVEGKELSSVIISVKNGFMFGHIDSEGDSYSIEPDNNDYLIVKHDIKKKIPFEDDTRVPDIKKKKVENAIAAYSEDGSQIDVLVLYTSKMQTKYGAKLAALIQHFVDYANTAYTNSGINTKLRMVHSELFNDIKSEEKVKISPALDYITNSSNVAALRNNYKADLVSLLRVYDNSFESTCGLGWIMQNVNSSFSDSAFTVVQVKPDSGGGGYYCDESTFAHELGHNMGCAHDRDHASNPGAYDYSYGYDVKNVFGTIMSYDGPTKPYFSTPLVNYNGYPVGKDVNEPDSAYNALTINNTRVTVANFKIADPTQPNENLPDLSAKGVKLPAVTKTGKTIVLNATGKNIGKKEASSFKVSFYLSQNNNKSVDADTLLDEKILLTLKKGKTKTVSLQWNVPVDLAKGNYYVKAFWDSGNSVSESDEENNIRASKILKVK